jgi:hypothetical protein
MPAQPFMISVATNTRQLTAEKISNLFLNIFAQQAARFEG